MGNLERFGVLEGRGKYYEEAIYSVALIYNICNTRITAYLSKYKVTPGKFNILLVLKHQGGGKGLSQVEISKHLIVTPSNMTKLIDKLEKDAFVTRSALPGDRRVNIIKITKKGASLLDKIWEGYNAQLEDLAAQLPKADQKIISDKLKQWLNLLLE